MYCTYVFYIRILHTYCTYVLYICIVHMYCTYVLYANGIRFYSCIKKFKLFKTMVLKCLNVAEVPKNEMEIQSPAKSMLSHRDTLTKNHSFAFTCLGKNRVNCVSVNRVWSVNVDHVDFFSILYCFSFLGGGGSLYSILRIHLDAQKDGSLSCGKECGCVLCLFKIACSMTSRKQVSKVFRPKLTPSLYLCYRYCNNRAWMPDIRNWVWYREGKAKYIQGPLYRYSAVEVALQPFDKFRFISKQLCFGPIYQSSIISDISEIVI